jgi:DNA modification methylase
MEKITWHIEKRRISDLNPAQYNPRKISAKQAEDLGKSLARFGLAEPIVINLNNTIIGGHQRINVLKGQGVEDVDVMVPDRLLSPEEEKELNLRLNKNVGAFDLDALSHFDAALLGDVGFTSDELSNIFDTDIVEDGFDAAAELAAIGEAETKRGDLYILGAHRLLCGDSTSHDDVARVMGGEPADMVFTDPPYNVNYNYDVKYEKIHKARKKRFLRQGQIFNDNKDENAFYNFLLDVFRNVYAHSKESMAIYVCHATKTQDEFFDAFRDAGFHFSQTIIWLKERIILALGQDYHRVYEPILFGWKKGESHYKNKTITTEKEVWDMDRASFEERLDVWFIHRDKSSEYEHPTQKPVRLPERAIKKNCPRGGVLLEPFGGSGSTMMACEQLGRRCFSIELDPKYCDVIVKRWERFTGLKSVRG